MVTRRHLSPTERLAIFTRAHGRCWICGEKIGLAERWDIEHRIPLAMGGDEAKGSDNLQPAHARCHAPKTAEDVARIAKAKRVEAKHLGIRAPRAVIPGSKASGLKKKLDGTVVRR